MVSVDNTRTPPSGLAAIAVVAMFMVLAVTGSLPAWVAGQPTASTPEAPAASGGAASARDQIMGSRTGSGDVGLRGHGFVRDSNGAFATIDAEGAGSFTVAFGIDDHGRIVGFYF